MPEWKPTKIEIGAGVFILACVAAVSWVRSKPDAAPGPDRVQIERQAMEARTRQLEDATFTICHDAVKASLRAPSTATIRSTHLSFASSTGTALLQVDAENGFGAMVREVFDCETQTDGGIMKITRLTRIPT